MSTSPSTRARSWSSSAPTARARRRRIRADQRDDRRQGRRSSFDGTLGRSARSPRRSSGSGVAHVPQGRGTFADLTVEENLRLGRLHPQGRATSPPTSTAGTRCSPPRRAPRPGRGQHERRRAADAGHRPGADVAAPPAAARRAVARAWRRSSPRSCSDGSQMLNQEDGHGDARRRAERQPGARASPSGATCSRPARSWLRAPPRARRPTTPSARRTWGSEGAVDSSSTRSSSASSRARSTPRWRWPSS